MKKLFLLLGLVILTTSLWAKEQPNIIVHKSNGGHQAFLNCYNDIVYTPGEENMPATLNCTGTGWSFCRVPHACVRTCNNVPDINNMAVQNALTNAINSIIEYSESPNVRTANKCSKSVTISIPTSTRSNKTYAVKGNWQHNANGDETLYIYINTLNADCRSN